MGRVKYIDSMNCEGELDLGRVREGDRVRFDAAFMKHGDDEADDFKIMSGEEGEVIGIRPDGPLLAVRMPAMVRDSGGLKKAPRDFWVEPEKCVILVHSEDPRLSSHRSGWRRTVTRPVRRIAYAELVLAGEREAARALLALEPRRARLRKTAIPNPKDWVPIILWSLKAFEREFPGRKGPPSIHNRRHVLWALSSNAADLEKTLPQHSVDYEEEDEVNALLVQEMKDLAKLVERTTDREWREQLPELAAFMRDDGLRDYYYALNPPETPAADPDPAPPPVPPPRAPRAPAPAPALEMGQVPPVAAPEPRSTPAAEVPPPSDPPPEAFAPENAGSELPAAGAEGGRVPIGVHKGFEGVENAWRGTKVWASPGMMVRNLSTKEPGRVTSIEPHDQIRVQVLDDETMQPFSPPREETWDAVETQLHWHNDTSTQKVDGESLKTWRKDRRERITSPRKADLAEAAW